MILTGPSAKLARQSEQSSRIPSVTRPGPSNADLVFANSALVLELVEDGLRLRTVIVDEVVLKTAGVREMVLNRDSSRIEGGLYSGENQWACELPLDDDAIHV